MALAIWSYPQQNYFSMAEGVLRVHNSVALSKLGKAFIIKPFASEASCFSIAINNDVQAKKAFQLLKNVAIQPFKEAPNSTLPDFRTLVTKAVETLTKTKNFEKVVLSRYQDNVLEKFNLHWLDILKTSYPNAFIALFSDPKLGAWLTASPELLLKKQDNLFSSFALAGTKFSRTSILGRKEHIEQNIVTNFIENAMIISGLSVRVHKEVEHKAGALTHLLSVVEGKADTENIDVLMLLNNLHPTPAVGGEPKLKALEFITLENYDRELYTGYMGEISHERKLELYVNLRCAQLFKNTIRYYAGAGITKDSITENEFLETEAKMEVLKSVLLSQP